MMTVEGALAEAIDSATDGLRAKMLKGKGDVAAGRRA